MQLEAVRHYDYGHVGNCSYIAASIAPFFAIKPIMDTATSKYASFADASSSSADSGDVPNLELVLTDDEARSG